MICVHKPELTKLQIESVTKSYGRFTEIRDRVDFTVGGGELAAQFYDAGLLDEIGVTVAPTFLSGGAPLFPRTTDPLLRLIAVIKSGEPLLV